MPLKKRKIIMFLSFVIVTSVFLVGKIYGDGDLSTKNTFEFIKVADNYYTNYHTNKDYLKLAIQNYEKALKIDSKDIEACWKLARAWLDEGDGKIEKKDKIQAYQSGKEYAAKAVTLNPNSIEAHYYFFANQGRIGQTQGVLKSLFMVSGLKRELRTMLQLNPNYVLAIEGQGVMYYELPSFSGGDLNKSIEYIKKAIELDPNFALLYLDLAKVYVKKRDYAEAKKSLDKLLSLQTPTYLARYVKFDKPEAEKLLKDIEKRLNKK